MRNNLKNRKNSARLVNFQINDGHMTATDDCGREWSIGIGHKTVRSVISEETISDVLKVYNLLANNGGRMHVSNVEKLSGVDFSTVKNAHHRAGWFPKEPMFMFDGDYCTALPVHEACISICTASFSSQVVPPTRRGVFIQSEEEATVTEDISGYADNRGCSFGAKVRVNDHGVFVYGVKPRHAEERDYGRTYIEMKLKHLVQDDDLTMIQASREVDLSIINRASRETEDEEMDKLETSKKVRALGLRLEVLEDIAECQLRRFG